MTDTDITTAHQDFIAGDSDRAHRWIRRITSYIEAIVQSKDAQMIPTQTLASDISLVAFPAWLWVEADPKIVGRKATFRPGETYRPLLPIRVQWHGGTVQALGEGVHDLRWTVEGMGRSVDGTTLMTIGPETLEHQLLSEQKTGEDQLLITRLPFTFKRQIMTPDHIAGTMRAIEKNAQQSWWDFLTALERTLRECLERQHVSLMRDIDKTVTKLGPQDFGQALLDSETLDVMATEMTLGEEGVPGQSYLSELIDKCCNPQRFVRVDPQRYLYVEISRKAGSAVQQRVGDPAIGRKIRKVYADSGGADPEKVIALYRQEYPKDGLSYKRLADALNVIRDPMAAAARVDFQSLDIDYNGHSWYLA